MQEPGGFLETADSVVQPYSLPRNPHEVPRSPDPRIDDTVAAGLAPSAKMRGANIPDAMPSVSFTVETFDIEDLGVHDTSESASVSVAKTFTEPRTMRELAELAGRAEGEQDDDDGMRVGTTIEATTTAARASETHTNGVDKSRNGRRNTRSRTGTPRTRNGTSGAGAANDTKSTQPSSRKRKREESAPDSESNEPETDAVESSAPAKRSRTSKAPEPVPKSDRVLRTRQSKTAAQLQEEKEQEAAYRRAIA